MKRAWFFGPALILAATPAHATGGFDCWNSDRSIVLTGSFGNSAGMPMDAVFIEAGGRTISTAGDAPQLFIVRDWLDAEEIRIDLSRRDDAQTVIRLRARFGSDGIATGTLVLGGSSHPVRCEMERMDL